MKANDKSRDVRSRVSDAGLPAKPETQASPAPTAPAGRLGDDLRADSTERALHRATRKLEHARGQLAALRTRANADDAIARERLLALQDLQAEAFRLAEQLKLARLDAEESYCRVLELEADLRREQAGFVALQERSHAVGANLRQVLETHALDNARWKDEVDRVHKAHEHGRVERERLLESGSLRGELERSRAEHRKDNEILQAELNRMKAAHERDSASWQAEVNRLQAEHELDNTTWRAEVQRLNGELSRLAATSSVQADGATEPFNDTWG